ncbi:endonuclease/exonuclease/phosphatase family protein [Kitasatospora camelliae]|uniref:Endonuclease/exonuclease/phosphatase family protein n=1 Tax=Kitasatospora camelliae TaxID=3156397 RepID=A0AAU8K4I6_9ACTN
MITVATWNVLHRVHAENWGEDVPAHWPDEAARIAAISRLLAGRTERVIALQEVSGDQLTSLRDALRGRTVHAMRYPRTPRPRHGPVALADPAEYLVLAVDGSRERVAAEVYPEDPGKGLLAVRVEGVLCVATHVSFGERRAGQLARLAEVAAARPGEPALLLGDFNADRATVAAGLGAGFAVADLPPGGPPTRVRGGGGRAQWIDHVVVHGAEVAGAAVEEVAGLSDHNLVHATVTPFPA